MHWRNRTNNVHVSWKCILLQNMNNWDTHRFYYSAVLNSVKPIWKTCWDEGNITQGMPAFKRRLQTTHLCPQKSQTASTRSQLNMPRKSDLIFASPEADVNFSAHTRKRCCITGPRIKWSIILYKSVWFREARLHRTTHNLYGTSDFPAFLSK